MVLRIPKPPENAKSDIWTSPWPMYTMQPLNPPSKKGKKKGKMGKKGGYIDHSAMIFQNNYRRCPHT